MVRQGFWAAGGFRNIYSGLGPAAVGSAPNAAIFFCTYDTVKRVAVTQLGCQVLGSWSLLLLSLLYWCQDSAGVHMAGASLGEITACLVRVPVEIVKQVAAKLQIC